MSSSRAQRGWTNVEEEALRTLAPLGGRACAEALCRPLESVKCKARQLGISLRRKKTHPNPTLSTNPAVLKRIHELAQASLCPACVKRPVSVKSTGLCAVCHLDTLRAVHEEEIAKVDAQCRLWAARSKLRRRRRWLARLQRDAADGSSSPTREEPASE
jgi:hypothetical protein